MYLPINNNDEYHCRSFCIKLNVLGRYFTMWPYTEGENVLLWNPKPKKYIYLRVMPDSQQ